MATRHQPHSIKHHTQFRPILPQIELLPLTNRTTQIVKYNLKPVLLVLMDESDAAAHFCWCLSWSIDAPNPFISQRGGQIWQQIKPGQTVNTFCHQMCHVCFHCCHVCVRRSQCTEKNLLKREIPGWRQILVKQPDRSNLSLAIKICPP